MTIRRVTITAVKNEVMMPTPSVTANPRTGPEPSWNRISAAITMSGIGVDDGRHGATEALVDRCQHASSVALLFANALVNQDVRIHGHAHGEHNAGDAGQA